MTQAAPFDTGFIQWMQPDGTTFTARLWGDEFFWWMETGNGYRIVRGPNYWWYYATLDADGEFSPTNARVGKDTPPAGSYRLDRSASRIAALKQELARFNEQIRLNAQWFAAKQDAAMNIGMPVFLKVGVILIEFQDFTHYRDTIPPITRPNGYLKADFDSMMFSQNFWYKPNPTPQDPSPHPEGDSLYGSFRDYWWQMSRPNGTPGSLIITGQVVNPVDSNGVPVWIRADSNRSYYENPPHGVDPWRFLAYEAIRKADSLGYIDTTNPGAPNYYDKLAVIYARDAIPAGGLRVHADRINGLYYLMAERNGYQLYGTGMAFSHIGTHLHEFGHLIGFYDEYRGRDDGNTDLFNFDLMARGIYNGPGRKGECPATLSPYYRIDKGWISSTPLPSDTTNFVVQYNYDNPNVYRIDPAGAAPNEHYLIETRLRQGFDLYIPTSPDSFIYQPGTLLVWHHNIRSSCYDDRIRLKHADNTREWGSFLTDFFPSDPISNRQSLNDLTTPASTVGSPDLQNIPPRCNNERPAHFALNGIQKLGEGSTFIDTVSLLTVERLVTIPVAENWNMVSVPLTMQNYLKSAVFPEATSPAWAYVPNSGYVQKDTLKNGLGYWIKFGANLSLVLGGGVRETDTVSVAAGWNVVGSITDSTDSARVCLYPYPQNSFRSSFFRYDNGYATSRIIEPGRGYWVKVLMDGQLVFHHDPVQCGAMVDLEVSEFDHFIVTDAQGKKQDVYVANLDRDPSLAQIDLSMPPPFPQAEFDARFATGEYVKTVSPDSGVVELVINVETQAYPVTVSWDLNPENGIEYSIITEGMGKQQSFNRLAQSGSAVMTTADGGKFRMNAQAIGRVTSNISSQYSLAQNYPNPFNPETRIHFELPQDGHVRLVVYDLLGREVVTLVNESKKAGRYEVAFSATNLASGVYFYRLSAVPTARRDLVLKDGQAGRFNDVKKLMVLR